MRKVTRWIAERLFEFELDEDYQMGIRYGQQLTKAQNIKQLTLIQAEATKAEAKGIEKAIEALRKVR